MAFLDAFVEGISGLTALPCYAGERPVGAGASVVCEQAGGTEDRYLPVGRVLVTVTVWQGSLTEALTAVEGLATALQHRSNWVLNGWTVLHCQAGVPEGLAADGPARFGRARVRLALMVRAD